MGLSGVQFSGGLDGIHSRHRTNPFESGDAGVVPLFSGLLPADSAVIWAGARVKEFSRGEMLFLKGDVANQVVLLTSGFVKVTHIGLGGSEVIVRLSSPGDVMGVSGVLASRRHDSSAHAFRSCHVLTWEARLFRMLAERYPILLQNMVRILGWELLELEQRFYEVATEKVGLRVARQLIRLEAKMGVSGEAGTQINVSREELAQMTGTTLFTVSRLLSTWETTGAVIPSRETVTICDRQRLLSVYKES